MQKLIEKVKSGNVRAFKKLYNLKKDDGYQICLALCQDRDDAMEACQKAFIKIYKKIINLREIQYFESWFYRIMMNCSYDVIKGRRFEEVDQNASIIEEADDNYFHTKLILRSLKDLPDGYRTVFIMHFFQEMKHADIGKILDCTSETSRSQYARAKQKIKEILSKELNFEEI